MLLVMTVQLTRKQKSTFLEENSFGSAWIHHAPEEHVHVVILDVKAQPIFVNM